MYNKGWVRIVEASIGILIILGVLFALYEQQTVSNEPDLNQRARDILDEIATNSTIRDEIVTGNNNFLNAIVAPYIPESYLAFEAKICEMDDVCGKSTYTDGNVYSAERVVSSTIYLQNNTKVKLFIWRKSK